MMDEHLRFASMGELYEKITREDLIEASTSKPVRRLLQMDVQGLCEEGAIIIAEPVLELRSSAAPIRAQILEGVGQGEFLFHWNEVRRLAVEDWHLFGRGGYVLRPRSWRDAGEPGREDEGA